MQLFTRNEQTDYVFPEDYPIECVVSTVDDMTIRTLVGGTVGITDVKLPITRQTKPEELLQLIDSSPFLKATCEYLSITKPVVKMEKDYGFDGNVYGLTFTIYSQENDEFKNIINSSLYKIYIYPKAESDTCTVWLAKPTIGEEIGMYDFIPYKVAEFNLKNGNYLSDAISYDIIPDDILGVDIVYKADFKIGYYIPFYRFACRSNEYDKVNDKTMYQYYYIPAVDFKG